MTSKEIRTIRKELSMTQQDFASLLGVSISAIRAWETGLRNISGRLAQAVRDASLRGNRHTVYMKSGETLTIISE